MNEKINELSPIEIHKVKGYIQFFEQIPEDQWCKGITSNYLGQKCAVGHLQNSFGNLKKDLELAEILLKTKNERDLNVPSLRIITAINDSKERPAKQNI